jgi:putative transposase
MGRPLRRHVPKTYYFVTVRCHQTRFLLRPTPEINETILEWLVRAQRAHPGVLVLGFVAMSNHIHLLLFDGHAELASWSSYFLGNLARSVNRVHGRRGPVFERRYSAEVVLDNGALVDRLAYLVTNPAKAGLCEQSDQWPGLLLWTRDSKPQRHQVSWIERKAYRLERDRTKKRGAGPPDPKRFRVSGDLVIHPLPEAGGDTPSGAGKADVVELVRIREREFASVRRRAGRRAMTRAELLAQPWHAAPRHPKRSPRPLCHASEPSVRSAFLEGFAAFADAFRAASVLWRRGDRDVTFPPWSYPPGGTLVRLVDPNPG